MHTVEGYNEWWRPAVETDLEYVAKNLTEECLVEMRALRLDPLPTLEEAFAEHEMFVMVDPQGWPMGLFGTRPYTANAGLVWALTTYRLRLHKIPLMRCSAAWLKEQHKTYPILTNIIHRHSRDHIRWLRGLGFYFLNPHERNGHPFLEFGRHVCVIPSQSQRQALPSPQPARLSATGLRPRKPQLNRRLKTSA